MGLNMRNVGLDTATLTDEEIRFIDTAVVEAVRPQLIARRVMPTRKLPHGGYRTVRGYKETDMSRAAIDMDGQNETLDRVKLTEFDISVPVIHKEFELLWRDLRASRGGGIPLDTLNIKNAGRQVAEEEDLLCLSGEYSGFKAIGIEGLLSATGNLTQASAGAWGANAIDDINNAIGQIEGQGHNGPFALIAPIAEYRKLFGLIGTDTGIMHIVNIREICQGGIFPTTMLYAADGGIDSGLVLSMEPGNFEIVIGEELDTFLQQQKNMNVAGKVYEIVAPHIMRPTSICEITGIT